MNESFWKTPRAIPWAAAALALAALAAYAGTFSAPFELDDQGSILDNPTIRHLWPVWDALSPPHDAGGITVNGRPLLNFSLALNYAWSGTDVWSYHVVNLIIHVCAGLALFGVVRLTLVRMRNTDAAPVAFAVALLWILHPLQTEAVTYVIQRAESLVSLFYLLTLYCYLRGATRSPHSDSGASGAAWYTLSAIACLLGMATKEVMVSAPLIVLLHDRTFVAGSVREAWRARLGLYLGLFGTWILLGFLVIRAAGRGGTASGAVEMSSWSYALTQCRALVLYLRLAAWPAPLVFDYGSGVVSGFGAVWWQALVVCGLLAGSVLALHRRTAIGFLAAVFFAVLAPSSSLIPVATQTMAEHRMYLPLAAVAALAVLWLHQAIGRASVWVCAILALLLGALTLNRNSDYRDSLGLWQDTVAKYPESARAQNNLGALLAQAGRNQDAMTHFKAALAIRPGYLRALGNLAAAQLKEGDVPGALASYAEVLRVHPDFEGHFAYARMLEQNGNRPGAISHLEAALRFDPNSTEAHTSLATLLIGEGKVEEAVGHYQAAVKSRPDDANAHTNLGTALALSGRMTDALAEHGRAIALQPGLAKAHVGMALVLDAMNRVDEAIAQYSQAIQIRPGDAVLHTKLADALSRAGRTQEAALERARAAALSAAPPTAGRP